MWLAVWFVEFAIDLLLVIAFGAIAWLSFQTAAKPERAAAFSSVLSARLQSAPRLFRGNEWAYSGSGIRWYAFMIGLASLDFVLIAVHLVPIAFLSVACFLVALFIASFKGWQYQSKRYGVHLFGNRVRGWEILVLALVFGYQIAVLFLAQTLLSAGR
jgi:hypothetical protein